MAMAGCKNINQLSAEGKWDDVFECLNIDVNSTIELRSLNIKRSSAADDYWMDELKATANTLEVILAIILLFDQIFYLMLLWYLLCFAFKFIRYRGKQTLKQIFQMFKGKPPKKIAKEPNLLITTNAPKSSTKKKTLTFAGDCK